MSRVVADLRMLEASGIGRYLREVVPRLLDQRNHRFALLGDPDRMRERGLGSAESTLAPARAPIYSVAEQLELARVAPRDAELFWAPHFNIPLLWKRKLLVTVHDVAHLALPELSRGVHRRLYARGMFRTIRARADAVICVSHFSADELVRRVGIPASRIAVVHNGVDAASFASSAATEPHPRPYFLFVGNVKPHKNLVRLVQAFSSLTSELPHDLVLVGRREGFLTGDSQVGEQAARLGRRVHFTGEISDDRLRSYLAHAEALVFPSLYEGFGLPPLEAMAAGCPAIVSSAASLPEVCGEAALYFDPQEPRDIAAQMRRLVRDRALREDLVARGRERARQFTWERCARETGSVMRRVLEW